MHFKEEFTILKLTNKIRKIPAGLDRISFPNDNYARIISSDKAKGCLFQVFNVVNKFEIIPMKGAKKSNFTDNVNDNKICFLLNTRLILLRHALPPK